MCVIVWVRVSDTHGRQQITDAFDDKLSSYAHHNEYVLQSARATQAILKVLISFCKYLYQKTLQVAAHVAVLKMLVLCLFIDYFFDWDGNTQTQIYTYKVFLYMRNLSSIRNCMH